MPLEINPKMTKAESSGTTLAPNPDNSVFFVKFQPLKILLPLFLFSSKILQIRFLGSKLDKVITSTDVYEEPNSKYRTWSYFKNQLQTKLKKHPG